MKKILFIVTLLLSTAAMAQPPVGKKMQQRIKAQKATFITNQLNLTAEEAQKFWPIYNASEETTENIRQKELRTIKQQLRNNPDMSEDEASVLLNKYIAAEDKLHNTKLKLLRDLKSVISSKKIIRLKRAEDEFNRKLLKRLKEFRGERDRRRN